MVLSIIATVLYALLKSEQAARAKEKLDGEIKARKVENNATAAMVGGLEGENKATGSTLNDNDTI